MSVRDGHCDSLKPNGERCSRSAARGQYDFAWCWQHWRQRQGFDRLSEHSGADHDSRDTLVQNQKDKRGERP